jgi:hypothetical protein
MNLRVLDGTVDVGACEGRADTYFALARLGCPGRRLQRAISAV